MSVLHSLLATGNIVDVWFNGCKYPIDFLKVGFYKIMDQKLFNAICSLSSFEIMIYCPSLYHFLTR